MDIRLDLVPLLRCTYLDLFVRTFTELGKDVASDLSRARLPVELPECQGAYIPALPTLAFVASTVQRQGIADFGCQAGARLTLGDLDEVVLRELNKATTLGDALNSYCSLAGREQSHVLCHITKQAGGQALISGTATLGPDPEQYQYSEWLLIMSLMAIIRHAAGSDWRPSQIAFQSQPALGASVWKAFPGTRFLVGQGEACVSVPREILGLPWPDHEADAKLHQTDTLPAGTASHHWNFPSSLRSALRPYLAEGHPSIELAADLAGLSVRTLQRRLNQCHLRYSELVKQLRFDVAADLLSDPGKSVIDAACEVGFTDPSHFSRAFRQMAGVSPREYRRQQLAA